MGYELIEHTADLGIRVFSDTIETLFEESGRALTEIIGAQSAESSLTRELAIEGLDSVDLLVRWLQELLYLIEAKGLRISGIKVMAFNETGLKALVHGTDKATPLVQEIKAVTYHNLDIRQIGGTFQATVIFDV